MDLKLHTLNNLFNTLKRSNNFAVTTGAKTSDSDALNQLKFSMKKHVECHDSDSVRNTMLKHEEIFREQVCELHRLYQVQKMLMVELVNKEEELNSLPSEATEAVAETKIRIWSSASTSEITQSSRVSYVNQPAACRTRTNLLSRELSFCSHNQSSSAHIMGFDFKQPVQENTCTGERDTTQLQESWSDDGSEIDLTLSIACGPKSMEEQTVSPCPNADIGCLDPTTSDIRLRQIKQEKEEDCSDTSSGMDRKMLKSPP
ncbi:uncharacterized protein LOC141842303 [Curcuma longa]|uniref:uncharacterized protein LOC141842303 n=1 Tax=Curcuma longa TaxID=136217 RepID=UPI003D9EC724